MLQRRRCRVQRFGQIKVNSAVPGGLWACPLIFAHLNVVVNQINHAVKLLKLGLDTYDRVQSEFPILIFDSKISWSS